MNDFLKAKKGEFDKAIEFFKKDLLSLRTGRANPAILDGVKVEAYGILNPLNAVGNVSVADAKSLILTPYDRNNIKAIEKAFVEAKLGLGIVNEGERIRLTVPAMTEENRRDLVKKLNERMEHAKISLRKTRDEVKSAIEKAEREKEITEDDKFAFLEEMDKEIGRLNDELKSLRDSKEKDIMTI